MPQTKQNQNHRAQQLNPQRKKQGSDPVNSKVHGNRGAQKNPNRKK